MKTILIVGGGAAGIAAAISAADAAPDAHILLLERLDPEGKEPLFTGHRR